MRIGARRLNNIRRELKEISTHADDIWRGVKKPRSHSIRIFLAVKRIYRALTRGDKS